MVDADLKQMSANLQGLVAGLTDKYKADVEKYQLNVREGKFVKLDEATNGKSK